MAKKGKKQRITRGEGADTAVLTIAYPTIKKSLVVDCKAYSDAIQFEAMMHGFKQKYGDAKSGMTPAEKYEMVQRIIDAHKAGSWDVEPGARDTSAIVIEAVSRLKSISVASITENLDKLDEEARAEKVKDWASSPKVKLEIAKIRVERAEEAIDEDEEDEDFEM